MLSRVEVISLCLELKSRARLHSIRTRHIFVLIVCSIISYYFLLVQAGLITIDNVFSSVTVFFFIFECTQIYTLFIILISLFYVLI